MEKTFKQIYFEFLKDWKFLYIGTLVIFFLGLGQGMWILTFLSSIFFMLGPWILYRRMGWQTLFRYLEHEKLDESYRFKIVFAHYSFYNLLKLFETIMQIFQKTGVSSAMMNEKLFEYNSALLMPEMPGVYILVFQFFFFAGLTYLVFSKYHQFAYFKKHESHYCPNKLANSILFYLYIVAVFLLICTVLLLYFIGLYQKTSLGIPVFNKVLLFASVVAILATFWEWFDLENFKNEEAPKVSVIKYSGKFFTSLSILCFVIAAPFLFLGKKVDFDSGEGHATIGKIEHAPRFVFYDGQLVYNEMLEELLSNIDVKGKEAENSKKISEFFILLKQNGIKEFYTVNGTLLSFKYIELLERGKLASFDKEAKKYLSANRNRIKSKKNSKVIDLKLYIEQLYTNTHASTATTGLMEKLVNIYMLNNKEEIFKIALSEKNKALTLHKALSKDTDVYSEIARDAIMLNKKEYFDTDEQTKVSLIEELYNRDFNTAQMIAEEVPEMKNYIELKQEETFRTENPINKEHTQKRGPASFDIDEMK